MRNSVKTYEVGAMKITDQSQTNSQSCVHNVLKYYKLLFYRYNCRLRVIPSFLSRWYFKLNADSHMYAKSLKYCPRSCTEHINVVYAHIIHVRITLIKNCALIFREHFLK